MQILSSISVSPVDPINSTIKKAANKPPVFTQELLLKMPVKRGEPQANPLKFSKIDILDNRGPIRTPGSHKSQICAADIQYLAIPPRNL